MKKYVWGILSAAVLLLAGCLTGKDSGGRPAENTEVCASGSEQDSQRASEEGDKITIMHIDAEVPAFQEFIRQAEEELDMTIHLVSCPENADNRQAKISTVLAAGEGNVDIFTVNDEMISEFKHKGYLEALNTTVMTPDRIDKYPESYIQNVAMKDGKIYSVPYFMDIMVFWVNRKVIGDREVGSLEDFRRLLETDFGEGVYGYGSAWDSAYVYNELSQFINLFGGDYGDWNKKETREAVRFLYDMAARGQVPLSQMADQYEQMEQKFLEGKYGSIFMYSGAMDVFVRAGAYGPEEIQAVPLPLFRRQTTNIAAWQYVLNKASDHKEGAVKFLNYAAGREGSIAYAECMNRLPARLDIIREENLDIPGFEVLRDYVENTELKERPFSENPMEDIVSMGTLFQEYILGEVSEDVFWEKAREVS